MYGAGAMPAQATPPAGLSQIKKRSWPMNQVFRP